MTKSSQPGPNTVHAAAGARFLACLPDRYRPDEPTIARLAPKVAVLLANGWTAGDLLRRLTAGIDSAHDPIAALARRIEVLPLPKGVEPPARPEWCGQCDKRTRQVETPDDKVARCPRCHPQRVAAQPGTS